ncbi:hypothetical protein FA10DRAFT_275977 [Acaromyces ingoldii]|uniref:PCI domain-containing protein n=1 Tax=Acaromyces ingoldii TaxID=215250 RepID=A0A316YFS1_9BASI|nr:hypothetical protein FA10DRAFT_275977 [Acaromyces ingoldii]PWN88400.1 hypothetical protein FA10DRAFT_275977 [Acaromyces ingoldii]
MSAQSQWPQPLKDFANRTFNACTDSNRKAVQEELRLVILRCFQQGTIETTDWDNMQLELLGGAPGHKKKLLGGNNGGKKRSALAGGAQFESFEDRERREKRARRFNNEQAAFQSQEREAMENAMASSSLGARLGGFDPNRVAPHSPIPFSAARGGGWAGSSSPSLAFGDAEVADPNVIDWDEDTVVGLSTKLEKPYLRLTSAPDPKTVRTLPTLMQTLELLKKKWRTEANYSYICDQFKSMRQDLTVQRIKNDFTVKVYEIHARIALEKGDLGEYNQCQSQLRVLYSHGLPGSAMEFLAYRILYLLHTRNRRDVNALMAELTPAHKAEPAVAHALSVRAALATGNYHGFFRLYADAPNMNAYIMDHFVDRERANALLVMSKCFRPSLSLTFLTSELAFTDLNEAHAFLEKHQAANYVEPTPAQAFSSKSGSKKAKVPLDQRQWDTKGAQAALQAARDRLRTIDIKGQI